MARSQHAELGHFLRSRRARLLPEDVGLPPGGRRRSRGLRREEVAVLANLSPTWYTYLEQGRRIRPSAEVLDALADALRLNATERRYLHALGSPPSPQVQLQLAPPPDAVSTVRQLMALTAAVPYPAYAIDGRGALLGWNPHTTEWYDDFDAYPERERNIARWMFTAPAARSRIVHWERDAQNLAARIRFFIGTSRLDPEAVELVTDMRAGCAEFDRWWDSHDVVEQEARHRTFRHPDLGECTLQLTVLRLAVCPAVTVVFHMPVWPEDHPIGC